MTHALLETKTFDRPQSGGPSPLLVLPSGHGGPYGAEPQPMTSSPVTSPVGEEEGFGHPEADPNRWSRTPSSPRVPVVQPAACKVWPK